MKKYSEEAKRVAAETVQMFGGNTFDALVDTIELYWEAQREKKRLLQQTPCSTLRELLVHKLNDAEKPLLIKDDFAATIRQTKIKTLSDVIKMIDELPPVA